MPFQALTAAPFLGRGVKLNIMASPQGVGASPVSIGIGSRITIRFGHCCPDIAEGTITAVTEEPERVVLTVDGADWTLEPGPARGGISIPGIVSEYWFVR